MHGDADVAVIAARVAGCEDKEIPDFGRSRVDG